MTLPKAPLGALLLVLLLGPLPAAFAAASQPEAATVVPSHDAAAGSLAEDRLIASLKQERAALEARRKSLDQKELALKSLQAEVDKKLDKLKTLSASLKKLLQQRDDAENKRIMELGKMYGKMEPAQAAKILGDLDQSLAIRILSRMRSKAAGAILANMEQSEAASLSAAFSKVGSH